ncbi:MAG: apolipoprotein N-acyltransferase [Verrucomicrobiota bacterium]|jgi:apolipoprotein N-acyltransferase
MEAAKLGGLNRMLESQDKIRRLLAVGAGLILAASYPRPGIAGLAWVAPGALLAAAFGLRGRRAFLIGWLAGFAHYLASLYWLLHIPVLKIAPFIGWVVLSAYLALYFGAWTWFCCRFCPAPAADADPPVAPQLQRFAATPWIQRTRWTLLCAAAWVALEMIRARLLTGFPWNLLGVSQHKLIPLVQISSITGVYGVSFLVAWFSAALFSAAALFAAGGRAMRFAKLEVAPPLLVTVLILAGGLRAVMRGELGATSLKAALVQPSIPQRMIWDPSEAANRFLKLLELSETAMASKPDLVVWPEGAVPGFPRSDTNLERAISGFARRHHTWLVFSGDDSMPSKTGTAKEEDDFNAAFLVSPEGEFVASYHKQRLVMFGEYIPLSRWLPFLSSWTGMGNFEAGESPQAFRAPALGCKTSVLICFEDIFPQSVRSYVEEDTDFLINLTNDGWFGESAQQWQHAANAMFRAVENGLPLMRCANNGLTCWIDAQGRTHGIFFDGTTDIYGAGVKIVNLPLAGQRKRVPTFYRRHGDVFGWTCVALSTAALLGTWKKRSRK